MRVVPSSNGWRETTELPGTRAVDESVRLSLSKTNAAPTGGLTATWIEAQRGKDLGEEISTTQFKSARYGNGYYLLAWKETGTVTKNKTALFTLVIDKTGGVRQPKTHARRGGVHARRRLRDSSRRPHFLAIYRGNQLRVVTLTLACSAGRRGVVVARSAC